MAARSIDACANSRSVDGAAPSVDSANRWSIVHNKHVVCRWARCLHRCRCVGRASSWRRSTRRRGHRRPAVTTAAHWPRRGVSPATCSCWSWRTCCTAPAPRPSTRWPSPTSTTISRRRSLRSTSVSSAPRMSLQSVVWCRMVLALVRWWASCVSVNSYLLTLLSLSEWGMCESFYCTTQLC